jgi:hypothetical protein
MKKINPPSPPFRKGGMGGFENRLHPHPAYHRQTHPPPLPTGRQASRGREFS